MSLLELIRDDFAHERIDVAEMERRTELALQHGIPNRMRYLVPASWEQLPLCSHDGSWIDVTSLGMPERVELCARCGERRVSLFEH